MEILSGGWWVGRFFHLCEIGDDTGFALEIYLNLRVLNRLIFITCARLIINASQTNPIV